MINLDGAVSLAFWVVTIVNDIIHVNVTETWIDNDKLCFNGTFKVQLAQDGYGGWDINVRSSHRLSSLTSSHASTYHSSRDEYFYELKNKDWNDQLIAHQIMEIPFLACSPEMGSKPLIVAEFRRHQEICPEIIAPSNVRSIQAPSVLENQWNSGFQAFLNITPPVTIRDGWKIYLAFSRSLSLLHIFDAYSVPSRGDMFTLENMSWNKEVMGGSSLLIRYVGNKENETEPTPCARALFTWKEEEDALPTTVKASTEAMTELRRSSPLSTTLQPTTTINSNLNTDTKSLTNPFPNMTTTDYSLKTFQSTTNQLQTTVDLTDTKTLATSFYIEMTTTSPSIKTLEPGTIKPQTTANPRETNTTITPITPTMSFPSSCAKYDYNEVLHKSILFYEAQRSGALPKNNRIPWRGNSALGDKGDGGEDLTGGWYDAGDYVKFGFPMAFSTTLLTWGLLEFPGSYSGSDELQNMLDSIKWPLDYFIKAHVKPDEFYGQVGNGSIDHAYWGRPEDMTMSRPAYKINRNKPGSDLASETAAAMAAGSIAFREKDQNYSYLLLNHSKALYEFADKYRGKYSDSITDAEHFYPSSNYNDELVWGAAWLYKATGNETYLQKAEQYFTQYGIGDAARAFSWDEKTAGAQMLLYQLTRKSIYQSALQKSLDTWLPGGTVSYTPKGLAWRSKWGPNRYAANTAFLALVASSMGLKSSTYLEFGQNQIHYMLGDTGRSYVVGFGNNAPTRPHHGASSCPDKPSTCGWNDFYNAGPNPQILYGALVGGPDQNDFYEDKRSNFIMNKVACDYNAGFQSAVAGLRSLNLSSCEKNTTKNISTVSVSSELKTSVPMEKQSIYPTFSINLSASTVGRSVASTPKHTGKLTDELKATTLIEKHSIYPSFNIDSSASWADRSFYPPTQSTALQTNELKSLSLIQQSTIYPATPWINWLATSIDESLKSSSPATGILTTEPKTSEWGAYESTYPAITDPKENNSYTKQSISTVRVTFDSSPSATTTLTPELQTSAMSEILSIDVSPTPNTDVLLSTVLPSTAPPIEPHPCGDVTVPPGFNSLELPVVVLQNWSKGFTARINITAPTNVRDGWQIVLHLKNAISLLEVYTVTTTPSNGTKFTLKNKDYNKILAEGSVTLVDFTATKENDNDEIPCIRAVFIWAKDQPCPTIAPVSGFNSLDANMTIDHEWNQGISGKITVVVPDGVKDGWQVRVSVSTPIKLVVHVAASTPSSGTTFTLKNMDYNKALIANSSFVIDFTGTKEQAGSTVLCATALFLW